MIELRPVRSTRPAPRRPVALLFFAPILFLLLFFFLPLLNIFRVTLSGDALLDLLRRSAYGRTLWFTVWQAALSTALTLALGLPAAHLFARYDFRGRSLLHALTAVPFVMPTVVVAAAFRALLGPAGPINRGLMSALGLSDAPLRLEQTLTIILIAHVFYNVTIVVRLVGGFWANLNPNLAQAAQSLGATRLRAFREVTLPLLRPPLLAAAILIYLFTFSSFGVILLLGGPAFSTLETEIFRQYVSFLRPDIAAALSLLQIIMTFLLMSVYARWQQRAAVALDFRPRRATRRRPRQSLERLYVGGLASFYFLFLVAPLLALAWRSVVDRDGNLTLAYYAALPTLRRGSILFIPPLAAIRNSLGYALLTLVGATLLGLPAAVMLGRPGRWRRWLDPFFMLPLGASAVTLGFGYVVTYERLRTSPLLVLIAHILVALPFVIRSIVPVLQGIQPRLREAAAMLGAPPGRVWREIDLPLVSRAMVVGALFAFTVSLGEFGATSFIARPNSGFLTMPIAIARYLGQPGALNFGQALAMSTLLMLLTAVGFVAIERFRYSDIGAF